MKRLGYLVLALLMFGCDSDKSVQPDEGNFPAKAFIFMTDYQSAALASYAVGDTALIELPLEALHTDVALRSHDGLVYVIERFGKDAITVLEADDPTTPLANYSVGNGTNPQDIVVTAPDRAYVLRHQAPNVLIINPVTGDSLGTINLLSYADGDGTPEMVASVLEDGVLYVLLQLLDTSGTFWTPTGPGMVLAINTATNQVIHTFTLTIQNPSAIIEEGGALYVVGGAFGNLTATGIDRVDLSTSSVRRMTEGFTLRGRPSGIAHVHERNSAWVVVSQEWPMGKVYKVNIATGAVTDSLNEPVSPSSVAVGDDSLMIICDRNANAPGIFVYNAITGAKIRGPISASLPPDVAVFVDERKN